MYKELKRILEDKLESIEMANAISTEDVISLESIVSELSPEHQNFITKDLPIHKFTMRPTTTNLEAVKLKITSILNSDIVEEVVSSNNIISVVKRVNNLYKIINNLLESVKRLNNIDKGFISLLENFKYTIELKTLELDHSDNIEFIEKDRDTPILTGIVNTSLVEIAQGNTELYGALLDLNENIVLDTTILDNGNTYKALKPIDITYPILHKIINIVASKNYDKNMTLDNVWALSNNDESLLDPTHAITVNEFLDIYTYREDIIDVLTKLENILKQVTKNIFSPEYVKALIHNDSNSNELAVILKEKLTDQYYLGYLSNLEFKQIDTLFIISNIFTTCNKTQE